MPLHISGNDNVDTETCLGTSPSSHRVRSPLFVTVNRTPSTVFIVAITQSASLSSIKVSWGNFPLSGVSFVLSLRFVVPPYRPPICFRCALPRPVVLGTISAALMLVLRLTFLCFRWDEPFVFCFATCLGLLP